MTATMPTYTDERLTLENCICGDCRDCPDGYHDNSDENGPCICTPDCILEDPELCTCGACEPCIAAGRDI